nr:protein DOG1-like 4 isoform X2 [Coffea arabica]
MSFQRFYETWFEQLHQLMNQLNRAPRQPTAEEENHQLVQKVMSHYSEYYRVKSIVAKQDILSVFTAPWATTLERSLHWIAGWRPTTAFHLIYTEASIRFESQIFDILRGLRNGDLGDLSPAQFRRDGASDFVGMHSDGDGGKMEVLVRVVEKADQLRLKTIDKLVELFTPRQAAEFLIAAAHLQFGVRALGATYDRRL